MKESKASETAFIVLQGILFIADRPQLSGLISKEAKESYMNILLNSKEGRKKLKQIEGSWHQKIIKLKERLMMPGAFLHIALRKRSIEDLVASAISSSGITQIINLGAGFDPLAMRFSKKYPDVNFIEIDHPATQELKRKALLSDEKQADNLALLPIDFSCQSLDDELANFHQFSSDRPTLFIVEGLLMYLKESDVSKLFHSMKNLVTSEVKAIFTFLEPMNKNKNNFGIMLKLYLKLKGEPFRWLISREKLKFFLKDHQYKIKKMSTPLQLSGNYLPEDYSGVIPKKFESIVIAEKMC